MKKITLIKSYLNKQKLSLFAHTLLLIVAIFTLNMYAVPREAIKYIFLLVISFTVVFHCYDFWKYFRKNSLLLELTDEVTITLEKFPEPADLVETQYQELIKILFDNRYKALSYSEAKYSEFVDYYTMWVHQIKTPITSMGLLLQSEESAFHRELSYELFKIEQYVEMVLQFLRIENLETDLMLDYYQLDEMIKEVTKKFAFMFIHKKIKLNFTETTAEVLTDKKWLLFVIEQLLSNALKYTNTKGEISIYLQEEKTLVILDSGIGIQEEDLPRIFEKGFTGYNGRMDKKSSGIGLFLSRKVLDKSGHKISIHSEVGVGTRVEIDLSAKDLSVK